MLKFRDRKTKQLTTFVADPQIPFYELVATIEYLKKVHVNKEIYVFTGTKNNKYGLDYKSIRDLSKLAHVIRSVEARVRATRFPSTDKNRVSLFLGFDDTCHYRYPSPLEYTFITWDDYLVSMNIYLSQMTILTCFGSFLETCNYLNDIMQNYR